MNHKVTLLGAFVACCAIAFIIGKITSKPDPAAQADLVGSSTGTPSSTQEARPGEGQGTLPAGARTQSQSGTHTIAGAAAQKPLNRMKAILGNPSPDIRKEEWTKFITSLDSSQIQALMPDYPVRDAGEPYVKECQVLYKIWGQKDPQTAMIQADKENFFFRIIALRAVAESWAAADPAAASTWLQNKKGLSQNYHRSLESIIQRRD